MDSLLIIILIIVATVAVSRWYIKAYLQTKSAFQLIQVGLDRVTDEHLREKYPILIEDKVVDVSTLLLSLFKYQFVFRSDTVMKSDPRFVRNRHKYMVLQNVSADTDATVTIRSPNDTDDKALQLETIVPPHNVLILPYMWRLANSGSVELRGFLLNDLTHRMFG